MYSLDPSPPLHAALARPQPPPETLHPTPFPSKTCTPQHHPSPPNPQVSDDGQVVYSFEPGFRSTLRNRSLLQRLRPLWKKAQAAGAYLVRVAFGSALIVSVMVVWLAIIALTSSRDSDRWGVTAGCGGWVGWV